MAYLAFQSMDRHLAGFDIETFAREGVTLALVGDYMEMCIKAKLDHHAFHPLPMWYYYYSKTRAFKHS